MTLKAWELVSVLLSALVTGMFCGPRLALTRSFDTFTPDVFPGIVHRMARSMAAAVATRMPAALLSVVPVLLLSYRGRPATFYLNLAGLALFVVALLVTTVATPPADWGQARDRRGTFRVVRVGASVAGLVLLLAGAILRPAAPTAPNVSR